MKLHNQESEFKPSKRRRSYWEKLIVDEDIPIDELQCLHVYHEPNRRIMSVYTHANSGNYSSLMKVNSSEFNSDAYLEYRRRVFEQLAAEYDKEKEENAALKESEEHKVNSSALSDDELHSSHFHGDSFDGFRISNDSSKHNNDLQPSWDDSDLQAETYTQTPLLEYSHQTLPLQRNKGSKLNNHDISNILFPKKHSKSENELSFENNEQHQPLMTWSSYEEQIKLKSSKAESDESIRNTVDNADITLLPSNKHWRRKSSSIKKQKMDRERIRQKLSMDDQEDVEDTTYGSDKPWSKLERSYSNNNQALHICYINESCSSDENDPNTDVPSEANPSLPSPGFASPKGYGRRYLQRFSDASSHSSVSSSSQPNENTIIRHNHHSDSRGTKSVQEEMELEARFQLARAHQRAKVQAEEERRRSKTENKSSLAHRLVSVTLTEEISAKIKSLSLSKEDCRTMTSSKLKLILNDMHAKKQALNDELMSLLIVRDELKTEQDAKLIDVEDAKAMIDAVGPETTV